MNKIKNKIKNIGQQCAVCSANFEIWMNNSKLPEEKREKINEHFLSYCPVCSKSDYEKI